MDTMRAVLYEKGGRSHGALVDVPVPQIGEDEILIKVYATCICKPADFAHDGGYSVFGRYPLIPGHEFSGVVVKTGEKVTRCAVGDRVTSDANIPCGKCYYCERGEVSFCDHSQAYGQTKNGGFAQYVAVREDLAYVIPDGVSMRAASMTELVGCAFQCIERCDFRFSSDVLVLGCGASGTIIAQLAAHSGAGTVTVIDAVASKLARMEGTGVRVVLADKADPQVHEKVLLEQYPHGFDYIIDTTADSDLITRSIPLLKKGGRFVNYAFQNNVVSAKKVQIDTKMFTTRQLDYIGSTFSHFRFAQALKVIAEGKVDPMLAVTKILPLEDFFAGMDLMHEDPDTIKVLLEPNGSSAQL